MGRQAGRAGRFGRAENNSKVTTASERRTKYLYFRRERGRERESERESERVIE